MIFHTGDRIFTWCMCVEVPQGTEVMTFSHFKHSSFEFIHSSTGAKQKISTKTVMAHYCLNP